MLILIIIQIVMNALMSFIKDSQSILKLIGLFYVNYFNLVFTMILYPFVFYMIRNYYKRLMKKYDKLFSESNKKEINQAIFFTIFLCIIIFQYAAMGFINATVRNQSRLRFNPLVRTLCTVSFFISEIILLISFCYTINKALTNLLSH